MKQIIIKKNKADFLTRKHPWIYSGAVHKLPDGLMYGEMVNLTSTDEKALGFGFYFPSSLQIKVISFYTNYYSEVWKEKIHHALHYRLNHRLPNENTNAFRCFFGEADGIPGLVADYYNEVLVLHFHHAGLNAFQNNIIEAFLSWPNLPVYAIWLKSEEYNDFVYLKDGHTPSCPVNIKEYGMHFLVDYQKGQKTGFFLDQRENRHKLMKYSKNKNVLNLFSYTGAFSVYALMGGARHVVSVDSSEWAVLQTEKNLEANGLSDHEGVCKNVFDYLKTEERIFDIVVCDPPAFAKSVINRHQALMAYKRLNLMAMKKVAKGGLLFTFSCSGVVSRDVFYHTIASACYEDGDDWRILEMLFPGPDHPISPYFPEGDYLKGLLLMKAGG
ncbi:MAG: class I SAM-dependent rRNA methyltransferase [Bacteroidia bacterium]|nr:class I SAM-dependent rRNA methyltransferase [Bacteroidia bacterium]